MADREWQSIVSDVAMNGFQTSLRLIIYQYHVQSAKVLTGIFLKIEKVVNYLLSTFQ
jgi:hypothetical protein